MEHKKLNIISLFAVLITVIFGIFILQNRDEKMLGKFNTDALNNAETNVINAIAAARLDTEKLVLIENKTYMNFVRELMDIDAELSAVLSPIHHLNSVNNSPETQNIIEKISPLESDYASDMSHHIGVYNGFVFIKKNEYENLDSAQKTVVDDAIKSFEISGITLPDEKKARIKEISSALSKLSNDYSNNIIAANKKHKIIITDEKILGDMPNSDKDIARTDSGFEFSLLAPSYAAFMSYITDRDLRQKMFKNYATRAPENEKIIPEILKLRNESAKILGYENYADLAFEFRDAKNPAAAEKYLYEIADVAKPAADKDFAELKAFSKIDLMPWDIGFYSLKLQKEKYNIDDAETKPYFEINRTTTDALDVISEILDIKFIERTAKKWHKNVRYFDVLRDGKIIAGLYLDLQTRESKSGGAWANDFGNHYRDANNKEHLPLGVVVANFPPQKDGAPALLSTGEVSTFFHEMGHAVHLLLSKVDERDVSGFDVDWDVVEFPSQFLESFWLNPIVLKKIGRHYQTGEIIPGDLIQRIIAADKFQGGMFLSRQLEFGIFDLELHQKTRLDSAAIQDIKMSVNSRVGFLKTPDYSRHQYTFSHIFSGGYAAGYYSYLWAESLAADAYVAFDGNPFNKELAHKYRDTVLAMGGSKPMSQIYLEFLGRAPSPESLMEYYGLSPSRTGF